MLHYIIYAIAFQAFFLLVYDLFLKGETFFNWNRAYLLLTPIFSLILPLIKIKRFENAIPQQYIVNLPEIILGNPSQILEESIQLDEVLIQTSNYNVGLVIAIIGMLIAMSLFLVKLIDLLNTINQCETINYKALKLVKLKRGNQAFSFFNYVFLGPEIENEEKQVILNHEIVHVKERHTLDLILFELLRILFWFNPLVYIYQKRIMTLHEFIADASAIKTEGRSNYYQNLLAQVFETKNLSFINTFFKQSLIKKRIVMLTKSKSRQINLFKYAILIPMVFAMLIYSSCTQKEQASTNREATILENIAALKESIAAKGNMSEEEEIALKELIVLTSPKGVNHQYFNDVKDIIEIPFGVIENVPRFPGCDEGFDNEMMKKCMAQKVSNHVSENFNQELGKELGLNGKQRISVIFKVNNYGKVIDVKARAPHPELEKEAIRVINLLPTFEPGTQDGKAVTVPYSLPIIFEITD